MKLYVNQYKQFKDSNKKMYVVKYMGKKYYNAEAVSVFFNILRKEILNARKYSLLPTWYRVKKGKRWIIVYSEKQIELLKDVISYFKIFSGVSLKLINSDVIFFGRGDQNYSFFKEADSKISCNYLLGKCELRIFANRGKKKIPKGLKRIKSELIEAVCEKVKKKGRTISKVSLIKSKSFRFFQETIIKRWRALAKKELSELEIIEEKFKYL